MSQQPQRPSPEDVARPQELSATALTTPVEPHRHSQPLRGLDVLPSSPLFAGRFGRMFREAPIYEQADQSLRLLALTMIAKSEDDKDLGVPDDDENTVIPAGYTYLGQFVDHDITFDPASSLQRQNDPDALVDFRTPRFDLDSLYGRGPSDQPYLYAPASTNSAGIAVPDGVKLLLGRAVAGDPGAPSSGVDLPRNTLPNDAHGHPAGRALIGDPRNDENLIVSQLHTTFLRFHNAVVDHLLQNPVMRALNKDDLFKEAQRVVRWHYQWVVIHDFLRRFVGDAVLSDILGDAAFVVGGAVPEDNPTQAQLDGGDNAQVRRPRLLFYHWRDQPFIPIEFSVAAYRFGHSIVRPSYFFNDLVRGQHEQAHQQDPNNRLRTPIFGPDSDPPTSNLNGFRPLPDNWAFNWKFFFEGLGNAADGSPLPQPSYKLDTSLVNPLGSLPPEVAVNPSSLAERNLLRGKHLDLPSGQWVARAMGQVAMNDDDLELTVAGLHQRITDLQLDPAELDQRLHAIGIRPSHLDSAIERAAADLAGHAPLWYYILREAEVQAGRHRLGPVGGRIVAEVLIGLLWGDPLSYLRVWPNWSPDQELLPLPAATPGDFTMTDLIRFATT